MLVTNNKCRLCGSEQVISLKEVKGYILLKCKNCKLVQIPNEYSTENFNKIYPEDYFLSKKYIDLKTLYKEYERRLNLIMSHSVTPDSLILDYGCADGSFSNFINDYYKIIGVDESKHAIQIAKDKYKNSKIKFLRIDEFIVENSKLKIDAIMIWDVVEHMWDFDNLKMLLKNNLKNGGYVYISTPYIDSLLSKFLGRFWAFMTPPEHLSFFNNYSFKYIFTEEEYEILVNKNLGKWVNLNFLYYKLLRIISSDKAATEFLKRKTILPNISVYIASKDIKYLVIRKIC